MAQSSNAQREPSMEEILASIRRIIEDSDSSRKAGEADPYAQSHAAEANNVHAFRAGLNDDREPPSRPMSDADFPPLEMRGRAESQEAAGVGGARSAYPEAPDFLQAPAPAARADEIEMELSLDDFAESRPNGGEGGRPAQPEDASGLRGSLISDQTGRQVAASFTELSAAFDARSRKSFDQIAEEMMRPMLQDWLDNNLPHLVEKLVREEIERIARGAAPR